MSAGIDYDDLTQYERDAMVRQLRELLVWVSKRSNDAHQRKQSARTLGNTVRKELRRRLALLED